MREQGKCKGSRQDLNIKRQSGCLTSEYCRFSIEPFEIVKGYYKRMDLEGDLMGNFLNRGAGEEAGPPVGDDNL